MDERYFPYDPHVRDFVASVLTPCLLREKPCTAVDIGANFGLHTLSMLHFNTRVVSIEPQPDLCASLMNSVEQLQKVHMSRVRCGLLATSQHLRSQIHWAPEFSGKAYRYDGGVAAPFSFDRYGLGKSGVPVVALEELLADFVDSEARGGAWGGLNATAEDLHGGSSSSSAKRAASAAGWSSSVGGLSLAREPRGKNADEKEKMPPPHTIDLMKIDTDSIDCDILKNQVLPLIQGKKLDIKHLAFEANNCPLLGSILFEFSQLGYTVYRADLLHEVQWNEYGDLPANLGQPEGLLPERFQGFVKDVYELRFNRHLWQFKPGMAQEEWSATVVGNCQFFIAKVPFQSRHHKR